MPVLAHLVPIAAIALAVASGAAAADPAAAASTVLPTPAVVSVEPNDTPIDGWKGWLVWSRRTADGDYALLARTPDGRGISLPVAPQPVPIDASIGPGPDQRPLVVYSHCTAATAVPPTGCDVFRIDPQTGEGGPVPSAAQPDRDERFPSVWGTQIAFSLSDAAVPTRRAGVAVAALDGPAPRTAAYRGPTRTTQGKRTVPLAAYGPQGIDLLGRQVAFSWKTSGPRDPWRLIYATRPGTGRTLFSVSGDHTTVGTIGRPALGGSTVVAPVLRIGGRGRSEIRRSSVDGKQQWTLRDAFSAAQSARYGAAFSAAARTTPNDLVVVRRLASDGEWQCVNGAAPTAQGCELLRYPDARPGWLRISASARR